jgi:hypothetical protein
MSYVSFSEINTFSTCSMQHFWRYFMRLATRRYGEKKALHIGSMSHDTIEMAYKRIAERVLDEETTRELVKEAADGVRRQYTGINEPYFTDDYDFEIDTHVAYHIARMFAREIFSKEEYRLVASEYDFQVEIAGRTFIGFIDAVYERDDEASGKALIYAGEVKTWSNSRSTTNLKEDVISDLQTDLYMLALSRDPAFADRLGGKVYTVYKKPKNDLFKRDKYASLEEHKAAIDKYYQRARTAVTRVEVPVVLKPDAIEARIAQLLRHMDIFYKDPFVSAANFPRPLSANGWPCGFCEFREVCIGGADIDQSFGYKRRGARQLDAA